MSTNESIQTSMTGCLQFSNSHLNLFIYVALLVFFPVISSVKGFLAKSLNGRGFVFQFELLNAFKGECFYFVLPRHMRVTGKNKVVPLCASVGEFST